MIVPLSSGWYFVYIICMNPYQKIELKILVLLPIGRGREGVLDTQPLWWSKTLHPSSPKVSSGWFQTVITGLSRPTGASISLLNIEIYRLRLSGFHFWREPLYRLEQPEKPPEIPRCFSSGYPPPPRHKTIILWWDSGLIFKWFCVNVFHKKI